MPARARLSQVFELLRAVRDRLGWHPRRRAVRVPVRRLRAEPLEARDLPAGVWFDAPTQLDLDEGGEPGRVTVRRDGDVAQSLTVTLTAGPNGGFPQAAIGSDLGVWAAAGGAVAAAGGDLAVTFAAGSAAVAVGLDPWADDGTEGEERLALTVAPVAGVTPTVGADSAVARVFDRAAVRHAFDTRGASGEERARGIAVGPDGSVYVAGTFQVGVDFDPGAGTTSLYSQAADGFVAKYAADGTLAWARQAGPVTAASGATVQVYGVAVGPDGGVYAAGQLTGTVGFGGSPVTAAGGADAFVWKLAPDGSTAWAVGGGGAGSETVGGVAVGADGNPAVVGQFAGTAGFGGATLTAAGGTDAYVWSLGPTGATRWAQAGGGSGNDSAGWADAATNAMGGVAVGPDGVVVAGGYFTGSAGFGGVSVTGAGADGFVWALDAAGATRWARAVGGAAGAWDAVHGVAVDATGAVFATGVVRGPAALGNGVATTNPSGNGGDVLVWALNPDGTSRWAATAGGAGENQFGTRAAADGAGGAVLSGVVQSAAAFGGQTVAPAGGYDGFVWAVGPGGASRWVRQVSGSANHELSLSLAAGPGGAVWAAGSFFGTATFGGPVALATGGESWDMDAYWWRVQAAPVTLSPGAVAENLPAGAAAGTLAGPTGAPAGTTFALVAGAGDADNAAFQVVGGELRTAQPFDFEAKARYAVRVRATAPDGAYTERALAVAVTNVNEAPAVTGPAAAVSVHDGATAVGAVAGTDPDAGTTLTFSVAGGPDAAQFAVHPTTGALAFVAAPSHAAPADADADNVYHVTVRASDGALWADRAVAVTVLPRAAVRFDGPTDLDLAEGGAGGRVTVRRAGDLSLPLAVTLTASAVPGLGLAAVGTDLTAWAAGGGTVTASGGTLTATFAANQDTLVVALDARPDGPAEGPEGVRLTVAAGVGYDPGAAPAADVRVYDRPPAGFPFAVGGAGTQEAHGVATDAAGNVYVAGSFEGTVDFDPGAGTTSLTSAGGSDAFVAKYTPAGALVWVRAVGGSGNEVALDVDASAAGDLRAVGTFTSSSLAVGPNALANAGGTDLFVWALGADGTTAWGLGAGSTTSYEEARSVAIGPDGETVVGGWFAAGTVFGSGAMVYPSSSSSDAFVWKIDAAGATAWVKKSAGAGLEYGTGVAVDATGAIYLSGFFYNSTTWAGTSLTTAGAADVVLWKLTSAGATAWVAQAGGTGEDVARGVAAVPGGGAYVTGYFTGTAAFGGATVTSAGQIDAFVWKVDGAGATAWAAGGGGSTGDRGERVAADADGNAIVAGWVGSGNATFGGVSAPSVYSWDALTWKLDGATGGTAWVRAVGGTWPGIGDDYDRDVATDGAGNAYAVGSFVGTPSFGGTALAATGRDGFVWRVQAGGVALAGGTVAENAGAGALVGTLSAPADPAGPPTYTLAAGPGGGDNALFAVAGAELRAVGPFDYEARQAYAVRVRATYPGGGVVERAFAVTVTDANEPPRDVGLAGDPVPENGPAGAAAGTLTGWDPEAAGPVTFQLLPGEANNGLFAIDPDGVTLRATGPLDHERAGGYAVRVRATDATGAWADATVPVPVADANEGPDVPDRAYTVAENSPAGTVVGSAAGTDPDLGQALTYGVAGGPFVIDQATGWLAVAPGADLDSEAGTTTYALTVTATDPGGLSDTGVVVVTVTDVPEWPTDVLLWPAAVAENAPAGTAVGDLSAIDPDGGGHTFTVLGVNPAFAVVGTQLRTTASLDHEAWPEYAVRVRATDPTGLWVEREFTIAVLDVNEDPADLTLSNASVPENAGPGAEVGTLAAWDPEGGAVAYAVVGGDVAAFAVVGDRLRAVGPLDHEQRAGYAVTVRASDPAGLWVERTFAVAVLDVNEAPVIGSDGGGAAAAVAVPEGATGVTVVAAADPDAGADVRYSLAPSPDAGAFDIDPWSGALTFRAAPDFEAPAGAGGNVYRVTVRASDGWLTDEQTLDVTVADVNEAPSAPTLSNAAVAENAPAGTVVGGLAAWDPDVGDAVTFALVGGAGDAGNAAFQVVGGELRTAQAFDFEAQARYAVRVRATDARGGLWAERAFEVVVADVNEAPSAPTLSATEVPENQPGWAVGTLAATDPDAGDDGDLTFALAAGDGDADNGLFQVVGGELRALAGFDYEARREYRVRVAASDGRLATPAALTVWVADVNEAPDTPARWLAVAENAPAGTVVGWVGWADPDAGQTLAYDLPAGAFAVDAQTGAVTVADPAALDYEATKTFTLAVTATDDGTPARARTGTVTVTLADVDEPVSPPALAPGPPVPENATGPVVVGVLSAADPERAEVSFLVMGSSAGRFRVADGNVLVADDPLDFEYGTPYQVTVRAFDGNHERFATFTVAVGDVNETPAAPTLSNAAVAENAPGAVVGVLQAIDPDAGDSEELTFALVEGEGDADNGRFEVVGTGLRVGPTGLDFEARPDHRYSVRVAVSDGEFTVPAVLAVVATNVDERPSVPTLDGGAAGSVAENAGPNAAVGVVWSVDPEGATVDLVVDESFEAGALFYLAGNTLIARDPFDFETPPTSYQVRVTASDRTTDPVSAVFTVTVGDVNEAPVVADQAFAVDENAEAGFRIGAVTAEDPDRPEQSLTYAVAGGPFAIDPATGSVTVAAGAALDYEAGPRTYDLVVTVSDDQSPAGETKAKVTVTVNDVNEPPTDLWLALGEVSWSSPQVPENAPAGAVVGWPRAADPEGGEVTFDVLQDPDAPVPFAVDADGRLVATRPLDFEAEPTFTVTVVASDEVRTATKDFVVAVLDEDEPPTRPTLTFADPVPENAPAGAVVGWLSAADPEGKPLTFEVVAEGDWGFVPDTDGPFRVAADGRTLETTGPLNFERNAYLVLVTVTDGTFLPFSPFLVRPQDVNEPPAGLSDWAVELDENAPAGTSIGVAKAVDPDVVGNTVRYAITGGNTGGAFSIDETLGVVRVANPAALDYDDPLTRTFALEVTATDSADEPLSATATVAVTLRDVNEAPTGLSLAPGSPVPENATGEVRVGVLSAVDPEGEGVHFRLFGPYASMFRVDDGRTLVAVAPLDFEHDGGYWVTVDASDPEGRWAQKTFSVAVADENDPPVLQDVVFRIAEIPEADRWKARAPIVLGTMGGQDQDVGQELTYEIARTDGGPNGFVYVDPYSGELVVPESPDIDYEGGYAVQTFWVTATDDGWPTPRSGKARVTLVITDVDEPPVLSGGPYTVSENQPANAEVAALSLYDAENAVVTLGLDPGPGGEDNDRFWLDGRTLRTKGPFDFEAGRSPSYNVLFKLYDGWNTVYEKRTVVVQNVNEAPTGVSPDAVVVREGLPAGTPVATLSGIDPDADDTHTFELISGNGLPFALSKDGVLTTTQVLDHESVAEYVLGVQVTDSGNAGWGEPNRVYLYAAVTVAVADVDEDPTGITLTGQIAENTEDRDGFGTLAMLDPDRNDPGTFELVSGVPGNALFELVGGNRLKAKAALDFEHVGGYTVRVRATDRGGKPVERDLAVAVTDVNEAPGEPTLAGGTVREDKGRVLGLLSALDPDAGDAVRYEVVSVDGVAGSTDVVVDGQKLVAAAPLDYEARKGFVVEVRAVDRPAGDPAGLASKAVEFPITVLDVNEAPGKPTLDVNTVAENAGPVRIGVLRADDPDVGDAVVGFAFAGGTDDGRFALEEDTAADGSTTWWLVAPASFDFEDEAHGPEYAVRVAAVDEGGISGVPAPFTVTVADVDEAPEGLALADGGADENKAGASVGTFSSRDPEEKPVQFWFVPRAADNDLFRLTEDGTLTAAGAFDFETRNQFTVVVWAEDQTKNATEPVAFTVRVRDLNDAPTAVTLGGGTVAENKAAGEVVGTLGADDQDAGETFAYAVAGGPFEVHNGQLVTTEVLDFEPADKYELTITATDHNGGPDGLSVTGTFVVWVTDGDDPDANDAPTKVTLDAVAVPENLEDQLVGTLTGSDPDPGDTLTFSLPAGEEHNALFRVDGNKLWADEALDAEHGSYTVVVRVTDAGQKWHDEVLTVAAADANEAPTGVALTPVGVAEAGGDGDPVGFLSGTDPDAAGAWDFALPGDLTGPNDNALFEIDGYLLAARGPLDYEAHPGGYTVVVRVTDPDGLWVDQTLTVAVAPVSEAAPGPVVLAPAVTPVAEAGAAGAEVGTLSAPDADADDPVAYSLPVGTGDNAWFYLDGTTLRAAAPLDADDPRWAAGYRVVVRATDGGGLFRDTLLTVRPTAVNEAPTGVALTPAAAGPLRVGDLVGFLSGADPDATNPGPLSLSLPDAAALPAGAWDNGFFALGADGRLTVAKALPGWRGFTVRVRADDGERTADFDVPVAAVGVPQVRVEAADPTTVEGGSGGLFRFVRAGGGPVPATVRYRVGGSATPGEDFEGFALVGTDGTVDVPDYGAAVVAVGAKADAEVEGPEAVVVTLLDDPAYDIAPGGGEATVTVRDGTRETVSVTRPASVVAEAAGPTAFRFARSGTAGDLKVLYQLTGRPLNHVGPDPFVETRWVTIPSGGTYAYGGPADDTDLDGTQEWTARVVGQEAYDAGYPATAAVTVTDDDVPSVWVTAEDRVDSRPGEATGRFLVRRNTAEDVLWADLEVGGPATWAVGRWPGSAAHEYELALPDGEENWPGQLTQGAAGSVRVRFAAGQDVVVVEAYKRTASAFGAGVPASLTAVPRAVAGEGEGDGVYAAGAGATAQVTIDRNPLIELYAPMGGESEYTPESGPMYGAGVYRPGAGVGSLPALTVPLLFEGLSATPGDDFAAGPRTVTVPAGQSEAWASVQAKDDDVPEPTEWVRVRLPAVPAGYELVGPDAVDVYITDDDHFKGPSVWFQQTAEVSVAEGGPTTLITVVRAASYYAGGTLDEDLKVYYAVSAAGDFAPASGYVVIPANQTSAVVPLTALDDGVREGPEAATVTVLPDPAYDASRSPVPVRVLDAQTNQYAPQIGKLWDRTVRADSPLVVPLTATDADKQGVTFALVGGPAGAAIGDGGTFVWTPSEADVGRTFPVTVRATDDDPEAKKSSEATFSVTVAPTVSVTALDPDAAEGGGAATVRVVRTGPVRDSLTVYLGTGYAAQGQFTLGGGTWDPYRYRPAFKVVIPADQSAVLLTVVPRRDNEVEGDQPVSLWVEDDASYQPVGKAAQVIVADDPPVVWVDVPSGRPIALAEGEADTLVVRRSGGDPLSPVDVRLNVGGATAGGDPAAVWGEDFTLAVPTSQTRPFGAAGGWIEITNEVTVAVATGWQTMAPGTAGVKGFRVEVQGEYAADGDPSRPAGADVRIVARPAPVKQAVTVVENAVAVVPLAAPTAVGVPEFELVGGPEVGTATLAGGTVVYVPAPGFVGTDEFRFRATVTLPGPDGVPVTRVSNLGVVRVAVEPPPSPPTGSDTGDDNAEANREPTVTLAYGYQWVHAGVPAAVPAVAADPDGRADIVKVEWDFDYDGVTFTPADDPAARSLAPRHTFAEPGLYLVAVRVTDTAGHTAVADGIVTVLPADDPTDAGGTPADTLTVPPASPPPPPPASPPPPPPGTPSVTGSEAEVPVGGSVLFTAGGAAADSWVDWDFDYDGKHFEPAASGASIGHTFVAPGVYTVAAAVDGGDPGTFTVTVNDAPALVVFPPPDAYGAEGQAVAFDPPPEYLDVRGPVGGGTVAWDFDYDGETFDEDAVGAAPSHTYPAPGRYVAAVRYDAGPGRVGLAVVNVDVADLGPDVDAGADATIPVGGTVTFAGTATAVGGVARVEWDFGYDGETFRPDRAAGDSLTPSHTFLVAGTYRVALRAVGNDGLETVDELTVTVENVAPVGVVTLASGALVEGGTVYFAVSGVRDPGEWTPPNLRADWDGDGTFDEVPEGEWTDVAVDADGAWSFRVAHTYDDEAKAAVFEVADVDGLAARSTVPLGEAGLAGVGPAGTLTLNAEEGRLPFGTPVAVSFVGVADVSAADTKAGFTFHYQVDGGPAVVAKSPVALLPDLAPGKAYTVTGYVVDKDGVAGAKTTVAFRLLSNIGVRNDGAGAFEVTWTNPDQTTGTELVGAGAKLAFEQQVTGLTVALQGAGPHAVATNFRIDAVTGGGGEVTVRTDSAIGFTGFVGDGRVGPITVGAGAVVSVAARGDFGGLTAGAGSRGERLTFASQTGPITGLTFIRTIAASGTLTGFEVADGVAELSAGKITGTVFTRANPQTPAVPVRVTVGPGGFFGGTVAGGGQPMTLYTLGADGRIATVRDTAGKLTTYTYHENGVAETVTTAGGTWTFDDRGNLVGQAPAAAAGTDIPDSMASVAAGWLEEQFAGGVRLVSEGIGQAAQVAIQASDTFVSGTKEITARAYRAWGAAADRVAVFVNEAGERAVAVGEFVIEAHGAAAAELATQAEAFVGRVASELGVPLGDLIARLKQLGGSVEPIVKGLLTDPAGVLSALVESVGQGVADFFTGLPNELPKMLFEWLTGAAGGFPSTAGVDFSKPETVAPWLLEVFGLNWDGVIGAIEKAAGEGNVALATQAVELLEPWSDKGGAGLVAWLNAEVGGLTPDALVGYVQEAAVDLVKDMAPRMAVAIAARFAAPGVGVLAQVYQAVDWLLGNLDRLGNLGQSLVPLLARVGDVVGGATPEARATAARDLARDVTAVLNQATPVMLSFGAAQVPGLGSLPAKVADRVRAAREFPLRKVEQAAKKVIGQAKAVLKADPTGLEFRGMIGRPVDVPGGGEKQLWVVRDGGQPVVRITGVPGDLDPDRAFPGTSKELRERLKKELADVVLEVKDDRPGATPKQQEVERRELKKEMTEAAAVVALCAGEACFAFGSPIVTTDGWRAIEAIVRGDRVLTRDEWDPSAPAVYRAVEDVFRRLAAVLHLTAGGRLIRTTGEHPFYEQTRGWTAARELVPGDRLLCADGSWVAVEEVVDTGAWEVVYNLRVADHHTYFVGTPDWGFSVWAHNSYRDLSPAQLDQVRTQLETKAADMLHLLLTEESNSVRSISVGGKVLRTFNDTPTNGGRGPALAVVEDLKTGKIYYGQNQGRVVENLHPLLRRRLDDFLSRPENAYLRGPRVLPYPGLPGSHAEFDAINQALNARGPGATEADLADLVMVVIRSQNFASGKLFDPFVRCIVCRPGTQGVYTFTDPNS